MPTLKLSKPPQLGLAAYQIWEKDLMKLLRVKQEPTCLYGRWRMSRVWCVASRPRTGSELPVFSGRRGLLGPFHAYQITKYRALFRMPVDVPKARNISAKKYITNYGIGWLMPVYQATPTCWAVSSPGICFTSETQSTLVVRSFPPNSNIDDLINSPFVISIFIILIIFIR